MREGKIVSISFFNYKGINKWWALKQMQEAPKALIKTSDLQFFKLLGSGAGNGFSILPDLSVYAVLCQWSSYASACEHLLGHRVFEGMKDRSRHFLHVFMQPVRAKGTWDGIQPFEAAADYITGKPIAVLTRARIAGNKLYSFWKNVPKVSKKLQAHTDGIAFSKGIGEVPLLQQATFSIWKDRQSMVDYAYKGKNHQEMIRKTHQLGWYREELFAEFSLLNIIQNWPDFDMELLQNISAQTLKAS